MNPKIFLNLENNIFTIDDLTKKIEGHIVVEEQKIDSSIIKDDGYILKASEILDLDTDSNLFKFSNSAFEFEIVAAMTKHSIDINNNERRGIRNSEGTIYSFNTIGFKIEKKAKYRAFYKINSSNFLYDCFENDIYETEIVRGKGLIECNINNSIFSVYDSKNYIIIESSENIEYEIFSETCYNILIAIGFVSGKFIQNEVFIFKNPNDTKSDQFCYKKLRNSSFSIYQAIITNPYGYKHFLGNEKADILFKNSTLKALSQQNLSNLIELIMNNQQIQYAMVLFNETNGNGLSLLIKNNCFYIVLEVLKKFFYSVYQNQLPKDHTNTSNISKYKSTFSILISISNENEHILKERNRYLHGDIEDLEGKKMVNDMEKQITLIYRLILTYISFDGYVIDHYALRNDNTDNAFIKCERLK